MKIQELVKRHNELSKGSVDYEKYALFAATHHSTAIEGSTLTESQVINLLEYGKPAANKPFEHNQMVYDHHKALLFVVELARKKTVLSPLIVREIGAKVMYSTGGFVNTVFGQYNIAAGDFRLSSVRAGTRTFPDAQKVAMLVEAFCQQTNYDLREAKTFEEKCELAFKVHFDFVSIHPFGDGNGRTSRLLMNFVQSYFGLPLSIVFKQDRIKYINSLEDARNKENLKPFYDFMNKQYAKFLSTEIEHLQKI